MNKKAIEISKRQAAGVAATTKGRARTFNDKTKYNRKNQKIDLRYD